MSKLPVSTLPVSTLPVWFERLTTRLQSGVGVGGTGASEGRRQEGEPSCGGGPV